ncbi:coniferyl aldehyde dehydrogenase [Oceanicoccus sp. KOV_DT_Chl]|uniref:coniferyl aldehyde dehydrogenase n=1 Tax=Oceanicoccus sp. KOV_DT_Chl TaxID=1904639 RepID=UPI000C79D709|nr:coniferyl aldehyde dehydrogenase [Oceanicoccus sp. KOV_DT_Chl]
MTAGLPLDEIKAPLLDLVTRQRAAFKKEGYVAYETRVDRINRCIALLVDNQTAICDAVNTDFGCRSRHVTLMTDIFTSVSTLKNARKNLKKWMKPEKRKAPIPMNLFGAKTVIKYQPKGVVGIMTPWNVPVNMIFSPLADILAAGNRVIIKPSEFTPATAEVMKTLFAKYFEETEIAFANGGPEVGAAFSSLPLDHIIFTGATSIGKLVMKAAAENLTPVTLELGGKSPVIVSDSMPIAEVAEKLITGKSMNGGQLCISPDYAFIPASRIEAFITTCKETIATQFPTLMHNPDYVALINERHFNRIKGYIDDAKEKGARIVELNPANEDWRDSSKNPHHKIPLHLIIEPTDDMLCMQDEIFGSILNVKSYRKLDDCIEYINDRPQPLALYYFGKNQDEQEHILDNTIAGGVSVNDIAMHFACDDAPFGGVGPSGMGNYHGFEGFKTFSHAKTVFKQGLVNLPKLAGTLPPFGEKMDKMMAQQIKK